MEPPVSRALVFVCGRCGKRAGDSSLSYRLASDVKRKAKRQWGKREVRVVLTSCMDACPDNAISVSVQPLRGARAPLLIEACVDKLDDAGDALIRMLRDLGDS